MKSKVMQTSNKYQSRIDWLVKRVCLFKEIEPLDLYKKTRKRDIIEARYIIMVNLKRTSDLSYGKITAIFGLDHSSFNHAKKVYKNLFDTDLKFKMFVIELEIDYNNAFSNIISFKKFINNQVISRNNADNYSVARALVCH